MKKNAICPNCGKKKVKEVRRMEDFDIRGDKISVEVAFSTCAACGAEWENLAEGPDYLAAVYRMYREKHHMLQPEEIKALRKKYALTQGELTRLLGWGQVTLTRYEKGALQDQAHENALQLLNEPHNLLVLMRRHPEALEPEKYVQLESLLRDLIDKDIEQRLLESIFYYAPDINSGHTAFSLAKCVNIILFFCKGAIFKTKLNKLMFYADFKHFKEYKKSITGLQYEHLPYGPVPKAYELLTGALIKRRKITVQEIPCGCTPDGTEITGEEYASAVEPNLSIFDEQELETMLSVKKFFAGFGSKKISEFSHKERAYIDTRDFDIISYQYAQDLQI